MELTATPMPHQLATLEYFERNPYSIGALDIGTGKTLVAIMTAVKFRKKTLIVCPTYLVKSWLDEIKKFTLGVRVSFLLHERDYYPLWDTDICIITYSFLHKADILFEWAEIVHFEEAHYLKLMGNRRTDAAHRLVYENSIEMCYQLTGTPIENRVYEYYSLMSICNYNPIHQGPTEFLKRFPTYVEFACHFSNLQEFEVWNDKIKKKVLTQKFTGFKNVPELKRYLKDIFIRFKIDDVIDLPAGIDIPVIADYKDNPELLRAFEQFSSEGELNGISSEIKKKAAISTAPFSADYALNLIGQGFPTLVFSDHIESSQIIAKKLGVRSVDSTMKQKDRDELIGKFKAGEIDRLVGTTGVLGTGHNLQISTDSVINDLPWKPSAEDQLRGRTRRNGQKGTPRYHYIQGTIQFQKIRDMVNEKRKTVEAVV